MPGLLVLLEISANIVAISFFGGQAVWLNAMACAASLTQR
jgi:hypothetical protein